MHRFAMDSMYPRPADHHLASFIASLAEKILFNNEPAPPATSAMHQQLMRLPPMGIPMQSHEHRPELHKPFDGGKQAAQQERGVHFNEVQLPCEFSLSAKPGSPMSQIFQEQRGSAGSGVYFENREVNASLEHEHPAATRGGSSMMVMTGQSGECPPGQPLLAPPMLPSEIVEDDSFPMSSDPPGGMTSPEASRKRARDSSSPYDDAKRKALRQRLSIRDYRLSTEELIFVEAAAKLSTVVLPAAPPLVKMPPPSLRPKELQMPGLPKLPGFASMSGKLKRVR